MNELLVGVDAMALQQQLAAQQQQLMSSPVLAASTSIAQPNATPGTSCTCVLINFCICRTLNMSTRILAKKRARFFIYDFVKNTFSIVHVHLMFYEKNESFVVFKTG